MKRFLIAILLTVVCLGVNVQAQTTTTTPQTETKTETRDDETNLETQLFLIVASNQEVGDSKLPASLDTVVKQLRASLPFKNYRLVSTLINRVKNDGRLQLNWVGAPMTQASSPLSSTPSFSHFNIRQVKLVRNSEGQMIQMVGFSFGARVPIQMGAIAAGGEVRPTTSYEQTGLGTDISMREGEPVIVGTLNVGPSGDALILVVSAKRAQK
ncbi:MAG TPA: hypothetical protein VFO99_12275 [Pyrinomonadaceae bacterium]|nr:hypothetical protein [Pyrinomonadaceae bacterium]